MREERARLAEEIIEDSEYSSTDDEYQQRRRANDAGYNKLGSGIIKDVDGGDIECIVEAPKLEKSLLSKKQIEQEQQAKIDLWYSNPLFDGIIESKGDINTKINNKMTTISKSSLEFHPYDENDHMVESSKKKLARMKKMEKRRGESDECLLDSRNSRSKKSKDPKSKVAPGTIEFVKSEKYSSESEQEETVDNFSTDTKKALSSAAGMTLAAKLAADRKRALKDIVDDSFNRHAFGDREGLPNWFLDDEAKFNRPQKQITKEGIALLKSKQREIDARPIKKVMEAKARNRRRAERKIEAIKQKAALIIDSEEIGERQKSEQIQKMISKGSKSQKKETKLVIAKGSARGLKGRPKGVKGHYKMVDNRLKKDMRAKKRTEKRSKSSSGRKKRN
jgi:AdoMet-dependent rRNA methyltransferase SPB1